MSRAAAAARQAGAGARDLAPDVAPALAQAVVRWQRRHGRHDLPWQATRDPYRVWLSEVMLQQTQVATVLGYYDRFVERFADVRALAAAPLDEVLALWSGLGYYRRARHLHACAQQVVARHGGVFPRSSVELAQLPGIGRSTAAAIAAFCAGERVAILDGNVRRVLARVLGVDADLSLAANRRALWTQAEALLPARPADMPAYTQGLMDLGATVCRTRAPRCDACPLAPQCVGLASGDPARLPIRTRRLRRGQRQHALLLLRAPGLVWLQQRAPQGVWAGLWSLPEFHDLDAARAAVRGLPGSGGALAPVRHVLTHFDWRLSPWQHRLDAPCMPAGLAGRWFGLDDALALGLPAPVRRWLEATSADDDALVAQELVDQA